MAEANMSSSNNVSSLLDCPVYSDSDFQFLDVFSFWVEGVLQTTLAIFGIAGNTFASVIISRREMRNSFNLLLVSLACFDSTYLFGSILESFRKNFGLASHLHILLFPHLLYPFNQVAISGSIFMTVAIAWERYVAVHYPLDYNQAMNDANAMRKRLVKYVGPVSLLAFAFNIVKFFEANIAYEVIMDNRTGQVLGYEPTLEVAELRTHPAYSAYNNWSRLIIMGIIPFLLLVFFNTKIYKDIVERRRRRMRTHRIPRASDSNVMTEFVSLPPPPPPLLRPLRASGSSAGSAGSAGRRWTNNGDETANEAGRKCKAQPKWKRRMSPGSCSKVNGLFKKKKKDKLEKEEEEVGELTSLRTPSDRHKNGRCCPMIIEESSCCSMRNQSEQLQQTVECSSRSPSVTISFKETNFGSDEEEDKEEEEEEVATSSSSSAKRTSTTTTTSSSNNNRHNSQQQQLLCLVPPAIMPGEEEVEEILQQQQQQVNSSDPGRLRRRQVQTINERRRRFEDNLAAIFMGFVLVFLVCHFPRLVLNIHELVTIRGAMECTDAGLQGFSLWSLVLISISHVLLVLNSSINILIYCLLSSKFREECAILLRRISKRNGNGGGAIELEGLN